LSSLHENTNIDISPGRRRRFVFLVLLVVLFAVVFQGWLPADDGVLKIIFRSAFGVTFALLLYFIVAYHPFRFTKKETANMRFYILISILFFLVIVLERIYVSPGEPELSQPGLKTYTILVQLPFWGLLGFWLARDVATFRGLLAKLAMMAAIFSVVHFAASRVGIIEAYLQAPLNWPIQFFALFGYFWFLYQYFSAAATRDSLIGLICCTLEVFGEFHKPVVISGLVGTLILVWLIKKYDSNWRAAVWKMLVVVAVGTTGFLTINAITEGTIFDKMEQVFLQKYLHSSTGTFEEDPTYMIQKLSGGRTILWTLAYNAFVKSPVIGSGFGQEFENDFYGGQKLPVHSQYVDVLLSVGVVGFLIALISGIWFLRVSFAGLYARSNLDIMIPSLAFVFAIGTYNAGGSVIWFAPTSYLLFIIIGALLQLATATGMGISRRQRRRQILRHEIH